MVLASILDIQTGVVKTRWANVQGAFSGVSCGGVCPTSPKYCGTATRVYSQSALGDYAKPLYVRDCPQDNGTDYAVLAGPLVSSIAAWAAFFLKFQGDY